MVDWDEDGDVDLIAGESDGHIHYFENYGSVTNPFLIDRGHLQAGGTAIDVTSLAIPVVQDWNEDGMKDLVVGNDPAYIRVYLNVGTNANPVFNSYFQISTSPAISQIKNAPDIGDLNGDGLKDLAFGWWQGTVVFYPNSGSNASPVFAETHNLTALGTVIDPGGWTHLEMNDWDEDGDIDLLYGEWNGEVYLHLNLSNDMVAGAVPEVAPVQIPASGGSFEFEATIGNNTTHNLIVDIWTVAELPSGQETGALALVNVNIPAGGSIVRDRIQNVPASAPQGEYQYFLRWGQYPDQAWAEDSFAFTKLAAGDNAAYVENWSCREIEKDNISSAIVSDKKLNISPNPFNPTTTITFDLTEIASIKLSVFDISGREVANLLEGFKVAGRHEITFDGSNLNSGVYFAELSINGVRFVNKLLLLK